MGTFRGPKFWWFCRIEEVEELQEKNKYKLISDYLDDAKECSLDVKQGAVSENIETGDVNKN